MMYGLRAFAIHADEIVSLSSDGLVDPVIDLQPPLFMYKRSSQAPNTSGSAGVAAAAANSGNGVATDVAAATSQSDSHNDFLLPATAVEEEAYGKELGRFLAELLNMLPRARRRDMRKIVISPHGGLNYVRLGGFCVSLVSVKDDVEFDISFSGTSNTSVHIAVVESLIDCGKALAASPVIPVRHRDQPAATATVPPRPTPSPSYSAPGTTSSIPAASPAVSSIQAFAVSPRTAEAVILSPPADLGAHSHAPPRSSASSLVAPPPSPVTPLPISTAPDAANSPLRPDHCGAAEFATDKPDPGKSLKSQSKKRPRAEIDNGEIQATLSNAARLLKQSCRSSIPGAAPSEASPKPFSAGPPVPSHLQVSLPLSKRTPSSAAPAQGHSSPDLPADPEGRPDLPGSSSGVKPTVPVPLPAPPPCADTDPSSSCSGPGDEGDVAGGPAAGTPPGTGFFGAAGLVGRSKLLSQAAAKRRVSQGIGTEIGEHGTAATTGDNDDVEAAKPTS